jgi:hypothetical protein
MIMLTLLASLTAAFIALSASEPVIAANLKTGDQALALAEAGVERARWALSNPAAPASGLSSPLPDPVPAPYSNQLVALGAGAYQVTVTTVGADRRIVSVGTVLRGGAALPGAPPIPLADIAAQRVVQVDVSGVGGLPPIVPPGALTVGGSVQLTGNTSIEGDSDTCPSKIGVVITDVSLASGQTNTIAISGSADITGTPSATSTITNPQFQQNSLSMSDLANLKALAQAKGTYIQPTSSSVSLSLSNGLTFVDTINGQALSDPFDQTTDASKLATVSVTGNNTGSGWLVIMGSLRMSGNTAYTGLIFALNDIQATGNTHITGAAISQNAVDTIATIIDSQATGSSHIEHNCAAVANGGGALTSLMQVSYTIKPGTWKMCPSAGAC